MYTDEYHPRIFLREMIIKFFLSIRDVSFSLFAFLVNIIRKLKWWILIKLIDEDFEISSPTDGFIKFHSLVLVYENRANVIQVLINIFHVVGQLTFN